MPISPARARLKPLQFSPGFFICRWLAPTEGCTTTPLASGEASALFLTLKRCALFLLLGSEGVSTFASEGQHRSTSCCFHGLDGRI